MSTMKIALSGGSYATQDTVWEVPEDMVRPYSIFLQAWIAKGLLVASKEIYDEVAAGAEVSEAGLGRKLAGAAD
jgi:hypothetical protein